MLLAVWTELSDGWQHFGILRVLPHLWFRGENKKNKHEVTQADRFSLDWTVLATVILHHQQIFRAHVGKTNYTDRQATLNFNASNVYFCPLLVSQSS